MAGPRQNGHRHLNTVYGSVAQHLSRRLTTGGVLASQPPTRWDGVPLPCRIFETSKPSSGSPDWAGSGWRLRSSTPPSQPSRPASRCWNANWVSSLFERKRRGALTPKGLELLGYAEQMLRLRTDMVRHVGTACALRGVLRLGALETISQTWLTTLLKRIHTGYPGISLQIDIDTTPKLRKSLIAQELDISFHIGHLDEAHMRQSAALLLPGDVDRQPGSRPAGPPPDARRSGSVADHQLPPACPACRPDPAIAGGHGPGGATALYQHLHRLDRAHDHAMASASA